MKAKVLSTPPFQPLDPIVQYALHNLYSGTENVLNPEKPEKPENMYKLKKGPPSGGALINNGYKQEGLSEHKELKTCLAFSRRIYKVG